MTKNIENHRFLEDLNNAGVQRMYIDAHSHTNVKGSDGAMKPTEQIKYAYTCAFNSFKEQVAEKLGVTDEEFLKEIFNKYCSIYWAITDHNTISAFETISQEDIPRNMSLYSGLEYETREEKKPLMFDVIVMGDVSQIRNSKVYQHYKSDVVDYKVTLEYKSAITQYLAFKSIGLEMPELLDLSLSYEATGIRANDTAHDLMYEKLYAYTNDSEILSFRKTEGAKKAKQYLDEHGYNPEKGRSTYYRKVGITNPDSIFYVDQTPGRLTLAEIAYDALKAGNTVIIAHPGIYDVKSYGTMKEFMLDKYEILKAVVERVEAEDGVSLKGKFGFECAHRGMTLEQTEWVINFCNENGLIYSAGNDYHTFTAKGQKPFTVNNEDSPILKEYFSPEWFNLPKFN